MVFKDTKIKKLKKIEEYSSLSSYARCGKLKKNIRENPI